MNAIKENWNGVVDWDDLYEVSNQGKVRSKGRVVPRINGPSKRKTLRPYPAQLMKLKVDQKGYLSVELSRDGKRHYCKVHRLVALAFIPNPDCKPQVNHIDGDKSNNNVENLEWTTQSENMQHAVRTGLKPKLKGGNTLVRCKVSQIDPITNKVIATFDSVREASRVLKTHHSNISNACKGKQKTAAGFKWKIIDRVEFDVVEKKKD